MSGLIRWMKQEQTMMIMAALGLALLVTTTACDQNETTGERMDNAMEDISDGVDDAGDELSGDNSTMERIGEEMEDAGDEIQDSVNE